MKPPAFQFYADDFLAGTMAMSQQEVGAYIRLLCHQWSNGGIPLDQGKLRRIAGGKVSGEVLSKFESVDGVLRNRRLEEERQKQEAFRQKQSANAYARWEKSGNATACPKTDANINATPHTKSCSPSPSPIENTLPLGAAVDEVAKPQKDRKRNPLFDALAEVEGGNPDAVTKSAGGAIGKALSEIKAVCPDVTPEEIRQRAANYRSVMPPGSLLTATALAKHWGRCTAASPAPAPRKTAAGVVIHPVPGRAYTDFEQQFIAMGVCPDSRRPFR